MDNLEIMRQLGRSGIHKKVGIIESYNRGELICSNCNRLIKLIRFTSPFMFNGFFKKQGSHYIVKRDVDVEIIMTENKTKINLKQR